VLERRDARTLVWMDVALMVENQTGVTWDEWVALATA
jgi:hypothetical protein